jgi:hypothetical protein
MNTDRIMWQLDQARIDPPEPSFGMYFADADEANDWLEFDADEDEREAASYAENDRFTEWKQWRDA